NVAFGQVAAAGIEGKRAVGPHQLAVGYEWSALAAFAESQLLERHKNQRREMIVDEANIDVAVGHSGAFEQLVGDDGGLRPRIVEELDHRLGVSIGGAERPAHDVGGLLPEVAGSFGAGDDDGGTAVGLEAAIMKPQRVGNHPRSLMLLDGERAPAHDRVWVGLRMGPACDGDRPEMLAFGAVEMHVAAG